MILKINFEPDICIIPERLAPVKQVRPLAPGYRVLQPNREQWSFIPALTAHGSVVSRRVI